MLKNKKELTLRERINEMQAELANAGIHFILAYSRNGERGVVSSGDATQILGLLKFADVAIERETLKTFEHFELHPTEEDDDVYD